MEAVLEAVRRDRFGRNEAGRLRRAGRIPAVLYGEAKAAESLAVDPKALLLRSKGGANTLIALKVDGTGDTRVLVKEYQLDPVGHTLLHCDFYRVAMDKVLQVNVPVHLTGEAKGVKAEGGIVDFVHREIEIECLPANIPQNIVVDVSELGMHDGVRDADMLIVHVVAPKVEAEPEPAEGAVAAVPGAPAAPAEPEVIKKGKVEKPEDEKE